MKFRFPVNLDTKTGPDRISPKTTGTRTGPERTGIPVGSYNDANKTHSTVMVDELLLNNGYRQRVLDRVKNNLKKKKLNFLKNKL